jgi:pyrroloquinoline quinone (PQQ) biosynthesis protein C
MSTFEAFRRDVEPIWQMAMGCWSTVMLVHGRMERDALAMVTLQMYHYVKHTVPVMRYALAKLPSGAEHDEFRALLEHFAVDEAGHDELALRDLEAMGYDRARCLATLPLPTSLNLHGANRLAIDEYGPYYILGETYATESVGAAIGEAIHAAYDASPKYREGISFYRVHGAADVDHARRAEACLRRSLDVPGRYEPMLLGCVTAWRNLMLLGTEIQNRQLYPSQFQLGPVR